MFLAEQASANPGQLDLIAVGSADVVVDLDEAVVAREIVDPVSAVNSP